MSNNPVASDLDDASIASAAELASDGVSTYRTGISITSTTASNKHVVVSGGVLYLPDTPVSVGDKFKIAGGAAVGTYTIASIIDDSEFVVVEAIVDSTGSTGDFIYPAGARLVGASTTGFIHSSSLNVQNVLADLDAAISTGLTTTQHKTLRQLIHLADSPGDGFATSLELVSTPANNPFPTQHVWYTNPPTDTLKLVQIDVTYNGDNTINTARYTLYDTDGSTVLFPRLLDTLDYTNFLTPKVTRTFPMV